MLHVCMSRLLIQQVKPIQYNILHIYLYIYLLTNLSICSPSVCLLLRAYLSVNACVHSLLQTVHNKQSPCFKTTLNTDFACNMVKQLLFEVYDSDLKGNDSLLVFLLFTHSCVV